MTSPGSLEPKPTTIAPDDRDWTFVITDGCAECGFVPQRPADTAARLRALVPRFVDALSSPQAHLRPSTTVWSPLEYGCHIRDVCTLFRKRLALMLAEHDPVFANWDQDATAIDDNYFHQDPGTVSAALQHEAALTADAFAAVRDDQWTRPGRRSNGSTFTVATFAIYFLHDVAHHADDVT